MNHSGQLWLFFLMVFGVVILPGLDMAIVLASSLVGGRRSGFFAVAGIICGGACHVAASSLGIGILLKQTPTLFNAMLLLGALYLAWTGLSLLRSQSAFGALPHVGTPSVLATFRQAALTNLLNPKAYLFMLAVFPQFLGLGYGPIWTQCMVLGLIIAGTQAAVYGALAFAAGKARPWLQSSPAFSVAVSRVAGCVLIFGAVLTGLAGWRRL